MLLLLLDDLVDSLACLSELLLVLLEAAHVVLPLYVVHGHRQSHEGYYGVWLEGPPPAGEHEQYHSDAVVYGCRAPQVLMREDVQQLHTVRRLLLLLLQVLKLRFLLQGEFQREELLCLVQKHLIDALGIDDVLYCERFVLNLTVVLNLLELTLVHD
jgi:hypothetical protein